MDKRLEMLKKLFALAEVVDEKRAAHGAAVMQDAITEELNSTWDAYLTAMAEYQEQEQLVNSWPQSAGRGSSNTDR